MQQIINFIIRNKSFLLFLLLLFISITLTIQSHSYHKSKFINSANFISGGIYNSVNNAKEYFNLETQNKILQDENNRLRTLLFNASTPIDSSYIDSLSYNSNYKLTSALIIKNSYAQQNNVLTINKGKRHNIEQDFGVITSKGILGIIDNIGNSYATVLSILNTKSRISAQLKKTNHFGSLVWDAKKPEYVQLTEIPKIAPVQKGDTIITSGRSAIFPKGIPIGIIDNYNLGNTQDYYTIHIKLFNDMTNIEHVYIIKNHSRKEIINLLENSND